jgi:hypothetical protein
VRISESLGTPLTRTTITPRVDYTINQKNTLAVRYQDVRINQGNQGAGGFNLPSRAYNEKQVEKTTQITETAVISPQAINETRFQFMRACVQDTGDDSIPAINVQNAFFGGGPIIGNSRTTLDEWELTNVSTFTRGTHTFKWGGRVRGNRLGILPTTTSPEHSHSLRSRATSKRSRWNGRGIRASRSPGWASDHRNSA